MKSRMIKKLERALKKNNRFMVEMAEDIMDMVDKLKKRTKMR
jgi:hypothetical protein